MELMPHQQKAVDQLGNGKILWGGVGSGKTLAALYYYMENESDKDLYVITTAKKRDILDWDREASRFGIGTRRDATVAGVLTVDSWNNIANYIDVEGAFFIFDEQRVVGTGSWVKAFLRIAKKNRWILLSATPGDTWVDYAPVFIANGWYKNITEFRMEHVVYAPRVKYPKIVRYNNVQKLERLRNKVLVEMPYKKHTQRIMNYLQTGYDQEMWNMAVKERRHPWENRPIREIGELFRVMRRIVNEDPSKLEQLRDLMKIHPKLIVFYNFDYELEMLRTLESEIPIGEWNGHKKTEIPSTDRWLYLVQYQAGAEGWNCVETNAMVLYSLTYSYKNFQQALGRIDRLNTSFVELYYYILATSAPIDSAIRRNLREKRNFNEREFAKKLENW